jgi:hypothetical protein
MSPLEARQIYDRFPPNSGRSHVGHWMPDDQSTGFAPGQWRQPAPSPQMPAPAQSSLSSMLDRSECTIAQLAPASTLSTTWLRSSNLPARRKYSPSNGRVIGRRFREAHSGW